MPFIWNGTEAIGFVGLDSLLWKRNEQRLLGSPRVVRGVYVWGGVCSGQVHQVHRILTQTSTRNPIFSQIPNRNHPIYLVEAVQNPSGRADPQVCWLFAHPYFQPPRVEFCSPSFLLVSITSFCSVIHTISINKKRVIFILV